MNINILPTFVKEKKNNFISFLSDMYEKGKNYKIDQKLELQKKYYLVEVLYNKR